LNTYQTNPDPGLVTSIGQHLILDPVKTDFKITVELGSIANWSLSYKGIVPQQLTMRVIVQLNKPFPLTLELTSTLNPTDIEELKNWLVYVIKHENNSSSSSSQT